MQAKIIFRYDHVLTGQASQPNEPPHAPIFYKDQDTYFLCLRPGEETVTLIAGSYGKLIKDLFRKAVSEYFKDDPELLAKVVAGEYNWSDMAQIVNEYNQKKKPA